MRDPRVIAEYVRTYHEERKRLAALRRLQAFAPLPQTAAANGYYRQLHRIIEFCGDSAPNGTLQEQIPVVPLMAQGGFLHVTQFSTHGARNPAYEGQVSAFQLVQRGCCLACQVMPERAQRKTRSQTRMTAGAGRILASHSARLLD